MSWTSFFSENIGYEKHRWWASWWKFVFSLIFNDEKHFFQVFQFVISRVFPSSSTCFTLRLWYYSRWKLRKSEYYVFIFHEYSNLLKANTNFVIYFSSSTLQLDVPVYARRFYDGEKSLGSLKRCFQDAQRDLR